ncbi:MAG: bifunctional phosphopantothenoylcysteine decarboxylase/phosphopantothenate--cysteine ligase CoaBC [Clostridiales bacterium]|nr:bifunctional phosphopantothenoylcysteine decarboxylase/phosphopantothenate--cysteine ligase CoaBC [Clostridiales bacterium]
MSALSGKTILVGVSGGIAAYKTCSLVSRLVKSGTVVHVMMTKNATEFVTPITFESLSHNRVVVDTFDRNFSWEVEHVSLAKKADAVIIAPATANVIAKLACGIADDFLTTTVLACKQPIIIAPAMNTAMLENVATVSNIDTLASRGYKIVYGESGNLACGDVGRGRMAEPEVLFDNIEKLFIKKQDLIGKTVLVTAGATRVDIDPVRFISNRSSGKMGFCIAQAAYERGAKIVFIKGFTDKFDIPSAWTVESVQTTAQMLDCVKKHYKKADISVMAAAPCDYEITAQPQKIKDKTLSLSLTKSPDIAAWVGEHKGGSKLVIFAAETNDCESNAKQKINAKKADMVVLNDVTRSGAGFDVDTNIVTLITNDDSVALPLMKKREVADALLDKIIAL